MNLKKNMQIGLMVFVFTILVGCSTDAQSASPVSEVNKKETAEVVTEEVISEVEVELKEDSSVMVEETYNVIGGGYFYSEPFDDIYPKITQDDNGMFIQLVNGTANKYIIVAVKDLLKDFSTPAFDEDSIVIIVENNRVEITEGIANDLYTYIIYYLYEVE